MQRIPSLRTRLTRVFKRKVKRATGAAHSSNRGDVTLEVAASALEVVSAVTDGLSVPGLKGTIQVAAMVLKLAQTVKANKADCQELVELLERYLSTLQAYAGFEDADLTKEFRGLLIQLSLDLEHIHRVLEAMAHRKQLKRIFHVVTDKKRISECQNKLANHFQAFQLADQCLQDRHRARTVYSLETMQTAQVQTQQRLASGVGSVKSEIHTAAQWMRTQVLACADSTDSKTQATAERIELRVEDARTHVTSCLALAEDRLHAHMRRAHTEMRMTQEMQKRMLEESVDIAVGRIQVQVIPMANCAVLFFFKILDVPRSELGTSSDSQELGQ